MTIVDIEKLFGLKEEPHQSKLVAAKKENTQRSLGSIKVIENILNFAAQYQDTIPAAELRKHISELVDRLQDDEESTLRRVK